MNSRPEHPPAATTGQAPATSALACAAATATATATASTSSSSSSEPQQRAADATLRALRAATLATLLALIVLCVAWELWLAPTGRGTLAIKALPLLFCVAGLARHRMYTFRWLSLLVWLYFMEGVVQATTEAGLSQALAGAEVVLSSALFVFSAIYIRWRLRHVPAAPPAAVAAASPSSPTSRDSPASPEPQAP